MGETFRSVLRGLREARGLSLAAAAGRLWASKAKVGHIETGHTPATADFALAADDLFGTAPLLITLFGLDAEDDNMRRRALLGFATAALGVGAASGPAMATIGELIRRGMHTAVEAPEDWDPVIADFERRLVLHPTPELGDSLIAHLLLAQQAVAERRDADSIRAAARLSLLYGLHLGNGSKLADALGWYRTSTMMAGRSGDTGVHAYTLGRAASRGIYEGMTGDQAQAYAEQALAISSRPAPGALEAQSALVHLAALRGDLAAGQRAVAAMRDLAERLPAAGPANSWQRAVSFDNYLSGRIGTWNDAQRAWDEASRELAGVPLWLADARLYYALAVAREGDVPAGAQHALETMRTYPFPSGVLAMGVSDFLRVVPLSYRGAEIDELRTYAATAPGPWETI